MFESTRATRTSDSVAGDLPSGSYVLMRRRTSLPGRASGHWLTSHAQTQQGPFVGQAEGASRSFSLDVDQHFQIEKESTPVTDRGVLLLQQSFVPLMVIGLCYSVLYWWWGMHVCLVLQFVAVCIAIVWWWLLISGRVFLAKVLFLMNWYLCAIVMTMVLTKESGIPIISIVLAGIWTILFDVDFSRPLLCFIIVAVSSSLWTVLQYYGDGASVLLRDTLDPSQLTRVNAVMFPLVTVTTICFVCVLICWLKSVNRKYESQLRHECLLVDRIVLGLLPSQIVERLKNGERLIADWRPLACILFMDIVGFTEMCSRMPPRQVVQGLVGVFSRIESIVKKYPRIEKVKTIGDAFMCSSGLLDSLSNHDDIVQVAHLALELRGTPFSMHIDDENLGSVELAITFRFGMHCGEVVAGVMSKERFTFDVLGDTVNIASREREWNLVVLCPLLLKYFSPDKAYERHVNFVIPQVLGRFKSTKRFVLVGYSLGGKFAIEAAKMLRDTNMESLKVSLIDSICHNLTDENAETMTFLRSICKHWACQPSRVEDNGIDSVHCGTEDHRLAVPVCLMEVLNWASGDSHASMCVLN
jgi:class 3 adenylate cyclase